MMYLLVLKSDRHLTALSYCTHTAFLSLWNQLGELTEAEDALTEANALNNRNPEVWGYLSLICLKVSNNGILLNNV